MLALANCKTALAGMMSGSPSQQMEELQTIVTNAHTHLQQRQKSIAQQFLRVETHQVRRVDTPIPQQPATRATATPTAGKSTETPPTRQCSRRNSLSHLTADINLLAAPPALSTRSKVRGAIELQCVSRLRQPTQASLGKTEQAKVVTKKPNWRRLLRRVEEDVEQALGVMDKKSGKMMNFRQLLKHPKFSKAWSTSSANKFGQLTNGFGGRIKNPTNTIRFIHNHKVPQKG